MTINKDKNERVRIGALLKRMRIEAGMSQEEVAERTGLRQQSVARIEAGVFSTGIDIVAAIAKVYGKQINFEDYGEGNH